MRLPIAIGTEPENSGIPIIGMTTIGATATNILAARLAHLQQVGLIIRRDGRYGLTQKGLDLLPAMLDLIGWSGKYDTHTAAPKAFVRRIARDRDGLLAELTEDLRSEYGL